MRRAMFAGLLSCLAIPSNQPLHAQGATPSDSAQVTSNGTRADSAPMIVRVTSRKLPFMAGDLLMMNCAFSGDGLGTLPWACARHTTGTLAALDADSVAFVRGGRTIRLAARDVRKLEQFTGRSAIRTVGSSVMGALTGVAGAGMIGIGGGYGDNDNAFVATAVALGAVGAVIGAVRGGSTWKEVPRSFEIAPPQRR
jgi:hypothetical protein